MRHTGLDVTVYSAPTASAAPGTCPAKARQVLRWALFEAAKCAARPTSPDHDLLPQVKTRLGGNRAALSVARKLARRCRHTLAALGDAGLAPVRQPRLGQVA